MIHTQIVYYNILREVLTLCFPVFSPIENRRVRQNSDFRNKSVCIYTIYYNDFVGFDGENQRREKNK